MNAPHDITFTLHSVIQEAIETLQARGIEQARLEAELLMAHVLDTRREHVIVRRNHEVTNPQLAQFHQLVERRCRKEPLAYIVGYREFWSRKFRVNPSVLIPRPETEEVISHLQNLVKRKAIEEEIHVLDAGTGSGILAVIAAVELPQARVTAVDISAGALQIARENALHHQVENQIDFFEMDFMCNWTFSENNAFDYILSNPPYIPTGQMARLMPDIRDFEPWLALEGGPNGLDCYRRLIDNAVPYLKQGGYLIFEVGEDQSKSVAQALQANGLKEIEIIKDLSGHDRVVSARRILG